MRAFELFENIAWAVGKDKEHASNTAKNDLLDPDNELVWVEIKDLFDKTEEQQRLDVEDPVGGRYSIGNRVERARDYWQEGGYMDPPLVGWNDYKQTFNFTDGRHRLVAAYQLGERWAPVIVDRESVEKLRELVRTK
ncbi:hypothetical protein LCGC14_1319100 [marine sediment metagenome]|uniref:ParB/Sulfiredoxin domain-containing protein n=1 Tax=marine sediment metagenome TaxID=412755 RepID=A0A0F9KK12_9ZZZZ